MSINFEQTVYNVDEGEMRLLRLVLSSPSDMEITVMVLTNPGTASGKSLHAVAIRTCTACVAVTGRKRTLV